MTFRLGGSSVDTFADCEGRWAINNVKEIKQQYITPGGAVGIGQIIGTMAHRAGAKMLQHKRAWGLTENWKFYADYAIAAYRLEAAKGIKTDDTTQSIDGGAVQLERLIREFAFNLVPNRNPEHIEEETGFSLLGDEWLQVICHSDLTDFDGWIDDHKFSHQMASYRGQGGTYLLSYKNTYEKQPKGFRINHIRRVAESSLQPDLQVIVYPYDACIEHASKQVKRIAQVLKAWDSDRSETRRNWHFSFNANSKYCNKKTCSAFGTTFCNQWKEEEQ